MTSSSSSGKTKTSSTRSTQPRKSKSEAEPSSTPAEVRGESKKAKPVYASDVIASLKRREKAQAIREEAAKAKASGGKKGRSKKTKSGAAAGAGVVSIVEPPVESLGLPEIPANVPLEQCPGLVLRMAEEAFAKTGSWVVFYREMFGCDGVIDQLYRSKEARRYFEKTREFAELLEILTAIRSQDDSKSETHEPLRVLTVRMPRSMHEATVREAEELELSINNYCLTKLLQPASGKFTPVESGNRRGRRAGPQIAMDRVKIVGKIAGTKKTVKKAAKKSSRPRKKSSS